MLSRETKERGGGRGDENNKNKKYKNKNNNNNNNKNEHKMTKLYQTQDFHHHLKKNAINLKNVRFLKMKKNSYCMKCGNFNFILML